MTHVLYSIRLAGPSGYGREAPPIPVGNLLRQIPMAVRQAILMSFVG